MLLKEKEENRIESDEGRGIIEEGDVLCWVETLLETVARVRGEGAEGVTGMQGTATRLRLLERWPIAFRTLQHSTRFI